MIYLNILLIMLKFIFIVLCISNGLLFIVVYLFEVEYKSFLYVVWRLSYIYFLNFVLVMMSYGGMVFWIVNYFGVK